MRNIRGGSEGALRLAFCGVAGLLLAAPVLGEDTAQVEIPVVRVDAIARKAGQVDAFLGDLLSGLEPALRAEPGLKVLREGDAALADYALDIATVAVGSRRFMQLKVYEGDWGALLKSFLSEVAGLRSVDQATSRELAAHVAAFLRGDPDKAAGARFGGQLRIEGMVDREELGVLPEVPSAYYQHLGAMRNSVSLFSCRVRNPYPYPVEIRVAASFHSSFARASFADVQVLGPGDIREACGRLYPELPAYKDTGQDEKGVPATLYATISARKEKTGVWQSADFQLPTTISPPEVMLWEMPDPFGGQGKTLDLREGIIAWLQTEGPEIDELWLKIVKAHPDQRMAGYIDRASTRIGSAAAPARPNQRAAVLADARAIYAALQKEFSLPYSDISTTFSKFTSQRIALPRTVIRRRTGNCIDFSLLFASLLLRNGLDPHIIVKPGHALVGWAVAPDSPELDAIEATMINPEKGYTFDSAHQAGSAEVKDRIPDMYETSGVRDFPYTINVKRVLRQLGLQQSP